MHDAVKIKVARLCGMFGSEHAGERANAAMLADRAVKGAGLTWYILLGIEPSKVDDLEKLNYCMRNRDRLNDWELGFIDSIQRWLAKQRPLTDKQHETLDSLYHEVKDKED